MIPRVAIIILTYNRMHVLKKCLASVLTSRYGNYQVIVVDSASTDDTASMVMLNFPSVKLMRSKYNLGYTGGNNIGLRYAIKEGYDFLLILNDDTIVPFDLLSNLLDWIQQNEKIGIVNPKILDFETRCNFYNNFAEYNFYLGIGLKSMIKREKPREIGILRGTCFLVRKEVFIKTGLMDENFFMYFDEADLSYRINKAGYSMFYVPSAIVYHQMSHSFNGGINPLALYYSTRNELLFARKYLRMEFFAPLWVARFIIRVFQYTLKTRNLIAAKAIIRGFLDFTKGNFGKKPVRTQKISIGLGTKKP